MNDLQSHYPDADEPSLVGTYPEYVKSGGGYFYDKVLEYRVWIHPPDKDVYFRPFVTFSEAKSYSENTENAEYPLVLVYQIEHINEPASGVFIHIKEPRITEWKLEWLNNSKGSIEKIPLFLNKMSS